MSPIFYHNRRKRKREEKLQKVQESGDKEGP